MWGCVEYINLHPGNDSRIRNCDHWLFFSLTEAISHNDRHGVTFDEEHNTLDGPLHCDSSILKPVCQSDTTNEFPESILAETASIGPLEVDVRQQACQDGFKLMSAVWSPAAAYYSLQRDNATTSD